MERSSITAAEKRRFNRVEESVCAWVTFRKDSAAYGTLTMDLGMEGAKFSTLKNVNIGEQLLVFLQLPNMSIECKGKVCWTESSPGGLSSFGVRFLDLRDTERECLNRFLNQFMTAAT
jgi:Tfp pilus assembly protein PilZ